MTVPTKRQLRRLIRMLDNARLAREARFWRGKPKTADRIGHDRPVNRQARKELKHGNDPR